jgi:DNA-binding protein
MAEAIPENLDKIEAEKRARRDRRNDNVIFVGRKPAMAYVLAVMTQFSEGTKEVHVKARGKSISRAVDVAEVVKNKFMQDIKRQIEIGTDEVSREDNSRINVSTIDIKLNK